MSMTHGMTRALKFLDELRQALVEERRQASTVLPRGPEAVRALPLDELWHLLMFVDDDDQARLGITKADVRLMHDMYFYEGDRAAVNTLIMAILATKCAVNECPAPPYWFDRETSVYISSC